MNAQNDPEVSQLYRGTRLVWFLLGLLEVILAFRLILKLLGANAGAPFVDFVYSVSQPFVSPFLNVFPVVQGVGGFLEWATVLAMVVYWLIAAALARLLAISRPIPPSEAEYKLRGRD